MMLMMLMLMLMMTMLMPMMMPMMMLMVAMTEMTPRIREGCRRDGPFVSHPTPVQNKLLTRGQRVPAHAKLDGYDRSTASTPSQTRSRISSSSSAFLPVQYYYVQIRHQCHSHS